MRSYLRLKNFIIFFLIFYLFAGLSTEVLLQGRVRIIPPFFSWFLFNRVPKEFGENDFTIRILSVNGKALSTPILYYQAYGIVDDPQSAKVKELARIIGRSLLLKQTQTTDSMRSILEQIYLPPHITYQIGVIRYNTLERVNNGPYIFDSLGQFTKP